jgi:hypothetical protein
MAQESILAAERGRKKRSLREIADTKHRVSAPAGLQELTCHPLQPVRSTASPSPTALTQVEGRNVPRQQAAKLTLSAGQPRVG